MLSLTLRLLELAYYQALLWVVRRISRRPFGPEIPEALRLYRENIALKAQLDALTAHCAGVDRARTRVSVQVRAAQVFAHLLTRGNEPFQRYFISAPLSTVLRWAARFRVHRPEARRGGRPPLPSPVADLIVTLKLENPAWGQRRIRQELLRMGIRASEPTIARVLRDRAGPSPGRPRELLAQFTSDVRDALWALDFFAVQLANGTWVQALLVIDVHTRELLDLRAFDGWNVDAAVSARMFAETRAVTGRTPERCVHDRGLPFSGAFRLAVEAAGIVDIMTPARTPQFNCFAERTIGSVRRELLRHIRPRTTAELQFYLSEYQAYWNTSRAHQGLDGRTPTELSAGVTAKALDVPSLQSARLIRRSFAHGLLHGYRLIPGDPLPLAA